MLTDRQLNRATLARQLLLERAQLGALEVVGRLAGMQAQHAMAPFVGLWSRIAGFSSRDLSDAIARREVVKATFVRATLHLCVEKDYRSFRSTLQPMLSAASQSVCKGRAEGFDTAEVVEAGRQFIARQPRTFAEISQMLQQRYPQIEIGPLRYTVRTHLALVQVPTGTRWSFPGNPQFALADHWLDRQFAGQDRLKELFHRYLAAFGPASAADFQTWSGLRIKERIHEVRPGLTVHMAGRVELFDLPQAPAPDEQTPAPVRFLPEYDNLLLSHKRRSRVIAEAHRPRVFLPGLRVRSTFLVDGFVAGAWRVDLAGKHPALVLEPFEPISAPVRTDLEEEGQRLLSFLAPQALGSEVRWAES
ncbi:MAG: winged helix DNA-binding domain-containing protein [Actinomycetota bacterium]